MIGEASKPSTSTVDSPASRQNYNPQHRAQVQLTPPSTSLSKTVPLPVHPLIQSLDYDQFMLTYNVTVNDGDHSLNKKSRNATKLLFDTKHIPKSLRNQLQYQFTQPATASTSSIKNSQSEPPRTNCCFQISIDELKPNTTATMKIVEGKVAGVFGGYHSETIVMEPYENPVDYIQQVKTVYPINVNIGIIKPHLEIDSIGRKVLKLLNPTNQLLIQKDGLGYINRGKLNQLIDVQLDIWLESPLHEFNPDQVKVIRLMDEAKLHTLAIQFQNAKVYHKAVFYFAAALVQVKFCAKIFYEMAMLMFEHANTEEFERWENYVNVTQYVRTTLFWEPGKS
ncbi:hypothetical protein HDU76_012342 [Blyttiomyces sp. JEL0837]|nr:hypothetical protein HDU76_012342 [Blyttiomyces sp. JEL0837]